MLTYVIRVEIEILSIITPQQIDTELVKIDNCFLGKSARCQLLAHDYNIQTEIIVALPGRWHVICFLMAARKRASNP